jgi:hypothetical protein
MKESETRGDQFLTEKSTEMSNRVLQRRSFLKYAGAGMAGMALLAAGCKDNEEDVYDPEIVYFGTGDIAVLNYAYALEQLEAAFYKQVTDTPYDGITADETALLSDIRDHEIAHREFFKNALGKSAIRSLEVNFGAINFRSRDSVLSTAKAFEDLGVSAYNGAGSFIKSAEYLLLAGKIVSVEARHAALIRDLISNGSFADTTVVNAMGLDLSRTPEQVIPIAQSFLKTRISVTGLQS